MLEVCVVIILTIRVPFCGQWKQNLGKREKKPGIKYWCFWIGSSGWSWSVKQAEAQTSRHTSDTSFFPQMSKKSLSWKINHFPSLWEIFYTALRAWHVLSAELSTVAVGPSAAELWPLLLTPERAQKETLNFSDSPWSCSSSSPEPFVPWQEDLL